MKLVGQERKRGCCRRHEVGDEKTEAMRKIWREVKERNFEDCDVDYQEIYDDNYTGPTDTIFHQYLWQHPSFGSVFTVSKEDKFTYKLSDVVPGTAPPAGSLVYGYKKPCHGKAILDLNGGKKGSYNPNFKNIDIKSHLTNERTYATPNYVKDVYKRILSLYTERGYPFVVPDRPKKFTNQFIWNFNAGAFVTYIALRFVEKCHQLYIDVTAAVFSRELFGGFELDTYEPDANQYVNGHIYPLRVKVTTNFQEFQQACGNGTSIAYFDTDKKAITIKVCEDGTGFLYYRKITYNGVDSENELDYLVKFSGSFGLFKRSGNKLVPSNPLETDLLAQISEVVSVESNLISDGTLINRSEEWPIRDQLFDSTIYYTGMVIDSMNGGDGSLDVYVLAKQFPGEPFVYAPDLDPLDLPKSCFKGKKYMKGDNPITKIKEAFTTPVTHINQEWEASITYSRLPHDVFTGKTYFPETIGVTPPLGDVTDAEGSVPLYIHEIFHTTQSAAYRFLPGEALASCWDTDPNLSQDLLPAGWLSGTPQIQCDLTRGVVNFIMPERF